MFHMSANKARISEGFSGRTRVGQFTATVEWPRIPLDSGPAMEAPAFSTTFLAVFPRYGRGY
jgi:hypothetical protein